MNVMQIIEECFEDNARNFRDVKHALEDGEALAHMWIDDSDQGAVESAHDIASSLCHLYAEVNYREHGDEDDPGFWVVDVVNAKKERIAFTIHDQYNEWDYCDDDFDDEDAKKFTGVSIDPVLVRDAQSETEALLLLLVPMLNACINDYDEI